MCAAHEIEEGALREVRLKQMQIQRKLYAVYRQDRALSAAAQELVEILRGKKQRVEKVTAERDSTAETQRLQRKTKTGTN
jgi:DNA-binding transcriptional LysR family regulator